MVEQRLLSGKRGGTATAVLLASLLFYLPSAFSLFSREGEPLVWAVTGVVMATFYTIVFCVNYFLLVPWLLSHPEKRTLYFLLNLTLIIGISCLIPIWFELTGHLPFPKKHVHSESTATQYLLGYLRFILRDSIMMVLAATLAYALRLSEARERLRRRELEISAEKRRIELQNLKAQLNPHFLFNSLNNIYALIGFAPERAQNALHDLSNMLRFMIYDAGSSTVPLAKELQFISDYCALMSLRLNSSIRLEIDIMPDPHADIIVTPLIFLTLVENAFKHLSTLPDGSGFIRIEIHTTSDSLVGKISNTFSDTKHSNEGKSGVGLENVRRQLNLLYPGKHQFLINRNDGIFSVFLSVALESLKAIENKTEKTDPILG